MVDYRCRSQLAVLSPYSLLLNTVPSQLHADSFEAESTHVQHAASGGRRFVPFMRVDSVAMTTFLVALLTHMMPPQVCGHGN